MVGAPVAGIDALQRIITWLGEHGIECLLEYGGLSTPGVTAAHTLPDGDGAVRLRQQLRHETLTDIRRVADARDNLDHARMLAAYHRLFEAAADDITRADVRLNVFGYIRFMGLPSDWVVLAGYEFPGLPPTEAELQAYLVEAADTLPLSHHAAQRRLRAWLVDNGYAPVLFEDILLRSLARRVQRSGIATETDRAETLHLIDTLAVKPDDRAWAGLVDHFWPLG